MSDIELPEIKDRRLNRMVVTTVVVLSVVMAVGKIKDDNIVQAMQADQATKIDTWSQYQATQIKAHDQAIAALLLGQSPTGAALVAAANAENDRYKSEAMNIKAKALAAEADYNVQGYRDDQFDLSDGFLSIALAVSAIAALAESFGLLWLAWGSSILGVLFLVAGFAQLPIHPDALVAFLS